MQTSPSHWTNTLPQIGFLRQTGFLFALLLSGQSQLPALELDDLFPKDRVIQVDISISKQNWNRLRRQSRDRGTIGNHQSAPIPSPFTYFDASVVIDGTRFDGVGLRKKGFLGSLSSSRPSLKIKLNRHNPDQKLSGISTLTFNNNLQDHALFSQYLSYRMFHRAGLPAPRCAFAHVKVNGKSLGVYSHVESVKKHFLEREFGSKEGALYESTIVDFQPGWVNAFELKSGNDEAGRQKITAIIDALGGREGIPVLDSQATARAWVPTDPRHDAIWFHPDFDDSKWPSGRNGAGFETQSGYQTLIDPAFDFRSQVHGRRRSIYLRIPFELPDAQATRALGNLSLRVRYDDGFVAYLNGERVAADNEPQNPAFNSFSTTHHEDADARSFQPFSIADSAHLLRTGQNVLAIQGLNISESSSDMLIDAALQMETHTLEELLSDHIEMDAFYQFWATEGLLGFWDGYSGNRNNFFCYHNPGSDKMHFIPWGADSLFTNESLVHDTRGKPKSVKTFGVIAKRLWSTRGGKARYAQTMKTILDEDWDVQDLIGEIERLTPTLSPYIHSEQRHYQRAQREMIRFIRNRRSEVMNEIQVHLTSLN